MDMEAAKYLRRAIALLKTFEQSQTAWSLARVYLNLWNAEPALTQSEIALIAQWTDHSLSRLERQCHRIVYPCCDEHVTYNRENARQLRDALESMLRERS